MYSANNKKLPILVDMDGVLVDFVSAFYRNHVEFPILSGRLPPKEQNTSYWIEAAITPQNDEEKKAIRSASDRLVSWDGFFSQIEPMHGAVEGFKYLCRLAEKQGREVFICSAPHINSRTCWSDKALCIETYFGKETLNQLMLTRDKTLVAGCILIDDKPNPIGTYSPIWKHIVYDQPYNREKECDGKWRMLNWSHKEIESLIGHIKDLP